MEMPRDDGWINLYTTDTLLRYKSEWDPRLHAHTKGGYLDGEIRVPKVAPHETLYMTLETFPAEDVDPVVADVHPCMLHLVRMGMGKRYSWLEPVPTKVHWRQNFEIQGDKVSVINTTSELDVEKDGVTKRKVPAKDVVTEMRNNTIILGSAKEHLNLVFLKPKQTKCDATITSVLGDRLGISNEQILEQYKKHFVGKLGGINLMKIRVKVSFFNAAQDLICSSISPQTVVDNGNKKIGCMDIWDCWPRQSSPSGGRKVVMISEYDLADDVVPRFEVYDSDGNHRPEVEDYIVQPIKSASTMAIKNTTIIFLTPAQPNLGMIESQIGNFSLKLVAHRQRDGMTSKAFAFKYTDSCDHRMDGDEEAKIEGQDRAKPGHKKRTIPKGQALLQVPTGAKRARSASPGASSGYNTSSPVHESPQNLPDILLTMTKSEVDQHAIPRDVVDYFTPTTTECGEAEVRNVLNWPTSQDLKTEEAFEANKSEHGNSEDDLMEIFNIPKDCLLDPNSPEQLDQVPEEQHDSEDDLHMESLNTPTVIVSENSLWGRSNVQAVRSQQNVFLPPRNGGLIQTDSTLRPKAFKDEDFKPSVGGIEDGLRSRNANRAQNQATDVPEKAERSEPRPDVSQLLMMFTILFIFLLCVVQISCKALGMPLTTLPLIGITSILSCGILGAKFIRA